MTIGILAIVKNPRISNIEMTITIYSRFHRMELTKPPHNGPGQWFSTEQ